MFVYNTAIIFEMIGKTSTIGTELPVHLTLAYLLRLLSKKHAKPCPHSLQYSLTENPSSGKPVVWEKGTFLKKVKAG